MDKPPLRIAFVALAPFISGSERCLQLLVKMALKNGDVPFLILEKGSPLIAWGKALGVPTYSCYINPLKAPTKLHWLYSQVIITFIILLNRITVVHSNQIWSYRATVLPGKITKAIKACHFRDPLDSGSKWWLKEPPDLAIFISEYIEQQFHSVFGQYYAKNTTTLIDPIELPEETSQEKRDEIKKVERMGLKIPSNSFVFGFIGQVTEVKGLAEALYYLSQVQNEDWILLVAGTDPSKEQAYMKKCQSLILDYKLESKVKFLGFIESVSNFYYSIDVAILLSKDEPLGLIPLEAAAHYTPAIVSNCGGLPETVVHGETGWIINLEKENEIRNTMTSLINIKTGDFGWRARAQVEKQHFSKAYWANFCARIRGAE